MNFVEKNGLKISSTLFEFVNNEAIPGTGVVSEDFWSKFSKVVHELTPINKALIKKGKLSKKKLMTGMFLIKVKILIKYNM